MSIFDNEPTTLENIKRLIGEGAARVVFECGSRAVFDCEGVWMVSPYGVDDAFFENGAGLAENLYRYLQFWASTAESANELQNIS